VTTTVRPIELPRDAGRFLKAWWPIYEGDEQWVPPLLFERKRFFDPSVNPYFNHATVRCFMAYQGDRPVGTIAATVDHRQIEHEPGLANIGFFEFIEDEEVAGKLLEAACDWLREQGMTRVQGPFNFNSNHEFGLLVDGFDTPPMIANPHNRDYYGRIYEAIGMEKSMDWFAYWIDNDGPAPERLLKVNDAILRRYPGIRLRKVDLSKIDQEAELLWEIYNDAWSENWGHVHFNRDEFDFTVEGLKQILNPDLCFFVYYEDEVAGVSVTLPDFNQVAKKMNGRILPFGWWHYVVGRSRIDAVRVFVLGIKTKFQKMPLGSPLYIETWKEARKLVPEVRGAEASLVLETNHRMRSPLEKMGGRIYKTYRVYDKSLVDG